MDKNKQEPPSLRKLKEDMLAEIEFLKARLEEQRIEQQEKLLAAQSDNIAIRTEFKERESALLSNIQNLQLKLEKVRDDYDTEKRTWEELLKNREMEKSSLHAEIAVKESEAVAEMEKDHRRFFEGCSCSKKLFPPDGKFASIATQLILPASDYLGYIVPTLP